MRIGDHVFHKPSGETWIVARVDDTSVYPLGWPCTQAKRADCTLVEPCADEQHAKLIDDLTRLPADDPRHIDPEPKYADPCPAQ